METAAAALVSFGNIRAAGDSPSVIACGDDTFPKGTAFGGSGKVSGIAQRRPLEG